MKRKMVVRAGALMLASAVTSGALGQSTQQQMPMGQGMIGMGMMGGCPMMGMMGQSGMQGMMGQGMPGMMGQGMGPSNINAQLEGRLAYLKAELDITDAQATAWKEYAGALKARISGMQSMHQEMMAAMQAGTALDRVKAHAKMMESMVANMKAVTPALEALYKVLSDEQKKKADQLLGMM